MGSCEGAGSIAIRRAAVDNRAALRAGGPATVNLAETVERNCDDACRERQRGAC
jgi:hypothetical protein